MRGRVSFAAGLFPPCPFLNVIMMMTMMMMVVMMIAIRMVMTYTIGHDTDDIDHDQKLSNDDASENCSRYSFWRHPSWWLCWQLWSKSWWQNTQVIQMNCSRHSLWDLNQRSGRRAAVLLLYTPYIMYTILYNIYCILYTRPLILPSAVNHSSYHANYSTLITILILQSIPIIYFTLLQS